MNETVRRAVCKNSTNNRPHKRFITQVTVLEEWEVDEFGNFVQTGSFVDTIDGPSFSNSFTCYICGEQAIIEDK